MGTVLFHIMVFLSANFVTVQRPYKIEEQIVEVSLPIDEITFDPEMLKLLEANNNNPQSEEVYNLIGDANDSRERSYEDFSTQQIDQDVLKEAKELEQKYIDEWKATHPDEDPPKYNADIVLNKDDNSKNSVDNEGSNAFAGTVITSYDLKNRKAHSLEPPAYTCNRGGTVVIQIKVDQAGKVKGTSYLSGMSSSATECMINQAIKYAKRARFNYSSSAPSPQTGTITYKFVKK